MSKRTTAREAERFWFDRIVPMVVAAYERETGRKWVSGSPEVKAWVDQRFRTRTGKAPEPESTT